MKQKIFLWICLFLVSSLSADNNIVHPRTVHSASELQFPPFSFVSNGKSDGFSVELLTSVLHVMNIEVDFYQDSWHDILKDLEMGKVDILPIVGRTPEREKIYDFSVPYLKMHGALIVRSENETIHDLNDLNGKSIIIIQNSSVHEFLVRSKTEGHIVTAKTNEEALSLLSQGNHDVVMMQDLVALELIKKLGINNLKIGHKMTNHFKQEYGFAVQAGNSELLAILNEGLSVVIANGEYEKLYQKWLAPLNVKEHKNEIIIRILFIVVGVLILLGILASFWQWSLQKQVDLKTKELSAREKELEVLNASLESKIETAVEEIKHKDNLMIAQSRQAAMGEMLSMIAHQWRQPIAVVGMIANNIILDIELGNNVESKVLDDAMHDITKQVTQLSVTIDDFRNFFKPEKEKEAILVEEIVQSAINMIAQSLLEKQVVCSHKGGCDIRMKTYKNELIQVLINLINNAKDAIVSTNAMNRNIVIDISCNKTNAYISISDSAGGISEAIFDKLGEPYVSTKALTGTGLGLYMSKMIVEKHFGGVLEWKNKNGGAIFTLALPMNT